MPLGHHINIEELDMSSSRPPDTLLHNPYGSLQYCPAGRSPPFRDEPVCESATVRLFVDEAPRPSVLHLLLLLLTTTTNGGGTLLLSTQSQHCIQRHADQPTDRTAPPGSDPPLPARSASAGNTDCIRLHCTVPGYTRFGFRRLQMDAAAAACFHAKASDDVAECMERRTGLTQYGSLL